MRSSCSLFLLWGLFFQYFNKNDIGGAVAFVAKVHTRRWKRITNYKRDDLTIKGRGGGIGTFVDDSSTIDAIQAEASSEGMDGAKGVDVLLFRENETEENSSERNSLSARRKVNSATFVEGPDIQTKPDYSSIHGPLGKTLDKVMLKYFRSKMSHAVGVDSNLPQDDYQGLMDLTASMNTLYSNKNVVQDISHQVLVSLFPSWLPPRFAVMFSKPFPVFSARLNAWATMMAGTWLMGECEVNDCQVDDNFAVGSFEQKHDNLYRKKMNQEDANKVMMAKDQGVLVKRCRFLEESGCASVCVNSCKIPTQRFFMDNMGLPLTMTPDYETFECQFSFGLTPMEETELEATNTPCLSRCPTAGALRKWHSKSTTTVPSLSKTEMSSKISDVNNMCGELSAPVSKDTKRSDELFSGKQGSVDNSSSVTCPLM